MTTYRCPDWPQPDVAPEAEILGCGRMFEVDESEDLDDMRDCPHCGICFAPEQGLPPARLEHLRGEIRAERISYGELAELESLAEYIDPSDVELLEWAGVPEFPDSSGGAS